MAAVLSWLDFHGRHHQLARETVLVMSSPASLRTIGATRVPSISIARISFA
jgi:hypothetical protein